jgi:hypothetical protein
VEWQQVLLLQLQRPQQQQQLWAMVLTSSGNGYQNSNLAQLYPSKWLKAALLI